MTSYLDVHILQSVPPSCINRDDTGSPKSAVYGGVRRARVSSQAWKRATRHAFNAEPIDANIGVRTLEVVGMVAQEIGEAASPEDASALAEAVVVAAGLKLEKNPKTNRQETKYLVLVSRQQAATMARVAIDALTSAGGDVAAAITEIGKNKKSAKEALAQGNSIDLALFGRMVADDTDLNVDASCQVAHAISVHAADSEFDYFTAVDDIKDQARDAGDGPADAGAGMIGTLEFTSSTLYRYATINVDLLTANLGDSSMAQRAIEGFVRSFARSMPTGKANTFANHTLPEVIVVCLRDDQPVSYVGAFEKPVTAANDSGYLAPAVRQLVRMADDIDSAYGAPARAVWTVGVGAAGDALETLGTRLTFVELPTAAAAAAVRPAPEPVA